MKNSLLVIMLICLAAISMFAARDTDKFGMEYKIRAGDRFLIHIISLDTIEIVAPVTITGHLTLYPLASPVKVSGYSLDEAIVKINDEIKKHMPGADVFVDLFSVAPYTLHILGAVNHPGEYVADSLMTLYQSIQMAQGLSPAASKRIKVTRNEETRTYDMNRYFMEGDLSQNPLLFSDDMIRADFAQEFAKLYVVTDSVNFVEYFEMETEKRVAELLPLIREKYPHSDYQAIYLRRDGSMRSIEADFVIRAGDNIYLNPEESYVFVRGHVNTPGKFNFLADKSPQYYVSMAGGVNRVGSNRRITIVSRDGEKERYRGQELHDGDTILIPLSTRAWITDYLTPISTVLSLVTTIVILTR